jgi:ABC-type dipeptide/oligopeptide/nickel transport system ATPase subunit
MRGALGEKGEELARLDAQLAEAKEGHGAVLALVGEAGIGKSALARAVASRAAAAGAVVARAARRSRGRRVVRVGARRAAPRR